MGFFGTRRSPESGDPSFKEEKKPPITLQMLVEKANELNRRLEGVEVAAKEQMSEKKRFEDSAKVDQLTGLLSRAGLKEVLTRVVKEAPPPGIAEKREHRNSQIGLLGLDLDRFKEINDEFGHEAGDQVLQQAADFLQHLIRKDDVAGRLGGDEFLVVFNGTDHDEIAKKFWIEQRPPLVAGEARAPKLNEHPRLYFPARFTAADGTVHTREMTFSGGLTLFTSGKDAGLFNFQKKNEPAETPTGAEAPEKREFTYDRADKLTYVSKGKGRDRITLDPEHWADEKIYKPRGKFAS